MAKKRLRKEGIDYGFIGGIAGDVFGSIYERHNRITDHPEEIDLYHENCRFTDDTVMTVATMDAILTDGDYARAYREFGRRYPGRGYGKMFKAWVMDDDAGPYEGWGNGALMRIGPVGWAFPDSDTTDKEAVKATSVTHNSEEAEASARIVASGIYHARTVTRGILTDLKDGDHRLITPSWVMRGTVGYIPNSFTPVGFDLSCSGTRKVVDEVLYRCGAAAYAAKHFISAFAKDEHVSFERVIQTAISMGGDTDTIACVAGSLYGPIVQPTTETVEFVLEKLTPALLRVVEAFGDKYARL